MHDGLFFVSLVALIVISGFFSSSETAMMRLNRYRIRHLARAGERGAQRISRLLSRPDRLLGIILIGNTLANILASSVVTVLAARWYGQAGVAIGAFILTMLILIFAEIMPKTMAALYPEKVAYPFSFLLSFLLWLFYPLVWLLNGISNCLLRLCRVPTQPVGIEKLSSEELRTIVHDSMETQSPDRRQMMLRVLDLEKVTVEDLMVPRKDMEGIDMDWSWARIIKHIRACQHAFVPVYRGSFDSVLGVLNMQRVLKELLEHELDKPKLLEIIDEAYFIPESTALSAQLVKFRGHGQHIALVVDEYGDVVGLVTLEDILEEIVGEFALVEEERVEDLVTAQQDGAFLVEGRANVRELNRSFAWQLPWSGPKTLSGLIIEQLETIPQTPVCLWLEGYPIEITMVHGRRIKQVKIWPNRRKPTV
jgi:Mg2+/Co2+ transporter CorB